MHTKQTLLVTGGAGYIGSHTILEIISDGSFDVVSADNFSNSDRNTFNRIAKISGKEIRNYEVDLTNQKETERIFNENPGITGVIHFAALKSVPESVEQPGRYHQNNNGSLRVVLDCMENAGVRYLIFSSSCSVYGNSASQPVDENTPLEKAESPYGETKQEGERMIREAVLKKQHLHALALRYFNPVGAHVSAEIGEIQPRYLTNLVPFMCSVAAGVQNELLIHGNDYPTPDGTCIRDYVHVTDIARAHLMAFRWLSSSEREREMHIFNLGSGKGVSVQQAIDVFERVNHLKLKYRVGGRRPGDVAVIYSKAEKTQNIL